MPVRTRTFAMIKPDGMRVAEKIRQQLEDYGFEVRTSRTIRVTREQAEALYAVHRERPFYNDLIDHTVSGPAIVMLLEREADDAVTSLRMIMGGVKPEDQAPETIRGKHMIPGDPLYKNLIHGSDSPEAAEREKGIFFSWFKD